MSERDTLHDDWENRLRTGLRQLESDLPGLPGPDQARRTHLRRRTALTAVTAVAAVVVAGGTVLALNRPTATPPLAPTTTVPEPTGTAAPEPSTTPPSTTAPSTEPGVDPSSGTDPVVPTTIPDDFVLYETEPSHDVDVSDFTATEPIAFPPCDHEADPRLEVARTDARAVLQTGPEFALRVQLEVFADAGTAAAWLSAQQDVATSCIGRPSTEGETTVVEDLAGSWGQGVLWVDGYRSEDGNDPGSFGPGGTYTLMMRVGSAVATVQGYGEHAPALEQADPEVVAGYRIPLDQLAPKLCTFTVAGC